MKTLKYKLCTHENALGEKFYSAKYIGLIFNEKLEIIVNGPGDYPWSEDEWPTREKALEVIHKDAAARRKSAADADHDAKRSKRKLIIEEDINV